jgi:subfamily B ATP-binding cassette protein MsbA
MSEPKDIKQQTSDTELYGRLLSYVVPYWGAFLLSILGFLLYSLSNVGFLQLISYVIDSLNADVSLISSEYTELLNVFGSEESLDRNLIPFALIILAIIRGLGTFIGNYFINVVSTNLVHNLRTQLFDQLLALPSSFYDKSTMGHLVAKVTFHVTQVTGAATNAVKVLIREGFTVIGYLGFLLYLNWKLTLLFFAIAPVIALLVGFVGKRFRKISERIQDSMGDVTHVASETVQGYRVVRLFGGIEYERERFAKVSNYNRRQSMKMVVTAAISTPVIQLLVAIALAGIIWLVLDPKLLAGLSTGGVVVFITTSGLLAKPIRQLSEVNATIQKGLAAAGNIFDLFDEPVEEDSGDGELGVVKGRVEFRNVSFSYSSGQPEVLKDICFVAEPGETIALVGRSGSGKSTLASLIPRFYSPTSGDILVDDVPVQSLKLANLRENIALVTQQVTLFNDTIRNNIAYGTLRNTSDEEIVLAAKRAYAWDFISGFPNGLDTLVGDDGVLLSGGQRQRLAIARAFLKNAQILILDEATSALDSESESFIQAALKDVAKGRTTFIIAHRLSTIENADRIVVIDDGRIVEQGTHRELLRLSGAYANFHNASDTKARGITAPASPDTSELMPVPHLEDDEPLFTGEFNPLLRAWYSDTTWVKLLSPLGYIYQHLSRIRRRFIQGSSREYHAPVPVIIVGNINIGGTGKSPVVIGIANELTHLGYKVGIVSRGYGGISENYPLVVSDRSDPFAAGDEAVMIACRTGCPVVVDPMRVRAAKHLIENFDCDVLISDDGLQHYYLGRTLEIVVIDAKKGLGNGKCLPAGPLRESPKRLHEVDFVLLNGAANEKPPLSLSVPYQNIKLVPKRIVNLETQKSHPVSGSKPGLLVHALAGIGNPHRFFASLGELGYKVIEHPFPDHHKFEVSELLFGDSLPVLMTEKDAIKCKLLNPGLIHQDFWYLEVDVSLPSGFISSVIEKAGLVRQAGLTKTDDTAKA